MKPRANQPQGRFRRVLLATDGSENATRAARAAIDLAKTYHAELVVVTAIPAPTALMRTTNPAFPQSTAALGEYYTYARAEAAAVLEAAVELAKEQGVAARRLVLDQPASPVEAIVRCAEREKADLIVVGTRGLSGFRKLLIGSVSRGVVNHATCPVLVVR
ncbi:MAG TPA: universal stress protein [Thermoplasmata archaeon]|nr:universal stress protein [Thermoplasmata archaeon]